MRTWIASNGNRSRPAFLAPVPIQRAFRKSLRRFSSPQTYTHAKAPSLFPRRAASLQLSQECNRVAPCAAVYIANSKRTEVPVILLVDHGSRRAAANDMLSDVGAMLQEKADLPVYTAHMEIARPTIAEGVAKCVNEGATQIIVVPFFLSPGRHSTTDIPKMTAEAVANHPGVTYDVRPPIGTHPGIVDVILGSAGLLGSVQN